MTVNNRRRGAAGEREAGHVLAEHGWTNTERVLGQAREGGCDLRPVSPTGVQFAIEVKRRRKVALLYEALEQAISTGKPSLVMVRADGKPWLVVQALDEWLVGK